MRNTCGNYQYLSTIYANQPVGMPLRQVVAAIGLAGLATFWKAPNIMAQANNAYLTALRLVNTSLGNIEEAKSDQTVVSIMLLGLYEVSVVPTPPFIQSVTNLGHRRTPPVVRDL
jgi:hypothetical protein